MARFGVVVFPGSNCDQDTFYALELLGNSVEYVWHERSNLDGIDCIVLPGGYSYGDYLRTGSIARFSPLMQALPSFLKKGSLVIGICNGFQILLEAGLLPGAMLKNKNLKFICRYVNLQVVNTDTPFTSKLKKGSVLSIPIAHHGGNYYADEETLQEIEQRGLVVFRYCDAYGNVTSESNPNGSVNNIAGLISYERNIFGLMPHPERAVESILGSEDGKLIFESISDFVKNRLKNNVSFPKS